MVRIGNGAGTADKQDKQDKHGASRATGSIRATLGRADEHDGRVRGLETGWTVFSYLIAGMVAYGLIGWAIGQAVHVALLFPLGMMAGLAISVGFVIYRYGRQESARQENARQGSVERNDR